MLYCRKKYIRRTSDSIRDNIPEQKTQYGWLLLKLNLEKAYDKVDWSCVLEILNQRGFGTK